MRGYASRTRVAKAVTGGLHRTWTALTERACYHCNVKVASLDAKEERSTISPVALGPREETASRTRASLRPATTTRAPLVMSCLAICRKKEEVLNAAVSASMQVPPGLMTHLVAYSSIASGNNNEFSRLVGHFAGYKS